MKKVFNILFRPTTSKQIRDELRFEAEREAEKHLAAAEHHKALADMYQDRVSRISRIDAPRSFP